MKKIGLPQKIFVMGIICFLLALAIWNWTENQINFYLSRINSGLERMAQVQSSSNNVTRNHSGQLLWQEINAGEVIYVGNSIQTDKNSSTEILLDEGEKILIGPESLVRFVRENDKISLDLIEGKIEVKSPDVAVFETMRLETKKSERLVIKTPRGRLALNNSSLKLQADKNNDKNFKIEVISGAPELITNTEKKVLDITSTESEKIEVVKIIEAKPEIITPAENIVTPDPVLPERNTAILENPIIQPNAQPTIEAVIERQPAQALTISPPLTAPKVKSIKVKEVE